MCLMKLAPLKMFVSIGIVTAVATAAATAPAPAEEPDPQLSAAAAHLAAVTAELDATRIELANLRQTAATLRSRLTTRTAQRDRARNRLERATTKIGGYEAIKYLTETTYNVREQWVRGYRLAGGQNVAAFTTGRCGGIVGGEGGWSNPAINNRGLNANGSIDWGPAQINDRVWSRRFTEVTGEPFDTGIIDPLLNGFMAAVIEREHSTGLNAWVAYSRKGCGK